MKYTNYTYEPSPEMRKKMRDRWRFWLWYAAVLSVSGCFFRPENTSLEKYIIVTVPIKMAIIGVAVPYVMNRVQSHGERKAQRAKQQY